MCENEVNKGEILKEDLTLTGVGLALFDILLMTVFWIGTCEMITNLNALPQGLEILGLALFLIVLGHFVTHFNRVVRPMKYYETYRKYRLPDGTTYIEVYS